MSKLSSEVLLTKEAIRDRVAELAKEISSDYAGKSLTVVGILKGSFVFMSDLVRDITVPQRCEFIRLSKSEDPLETPYDIVYYSDFEIRGADVLIVEDILDSGITLDYLVGQLREREPASLKVAVLLDKRTRRRIDIKADYTGFEIPDHWVVGYGLDHAEKFRELPFITWVE